MSSFVSKIAEYCSNTEHAECVIRNRMIFDVYCESISSRVFFSLQPTMQVYEFDDPDKTIEQRKANKTV